MKVLAAQLFRDKVPAMDRIIFAAATGALFVLCAGATPAAAQVKATVSGDALYDDNIFRTSRQISDATGMQRDDTLAILHGEVNATFKPGETTVVLIARAGHDWYSHNHNLNNFNYDVHLSATKADQGLFGYELHAQSMQQLSSFTDLGVPIRNMQQVQHVYGQATVEVTPELRIVVVPDFIHATNGSAIFHTNDFNQYGAGVGLGYFSPLGNSISVTVTKAYTKGLHDRLLALSGAVVNSPIDIDETSVDLRLDYSPSVLTTITGRLSYVDRKNKSVTGGNYSGPAGSLSASYRPRDSLTIEGIIGRRFESQSYIYVETIRNDYASLGAHVVLAGGLRLGVTGDYSHRQFTSGTILNAVGTSLRDSTYRIGATLEKRLFERLTLKVTGQHERRNAENALFSYSSTSGLVGAAFAFGSGNR